MLITNVSKLSSVNSLKNSNGYGQMAKTAEDSFENIMNASRKDAKSEFKNYSNNLSLKNSDSKTESMDNSKVETRKDVNNKDSASSRVEANDTREKPEDSKKIESNIEDENASVITKKDDKNLKISDGNLEVMNGEMDTEEFIKSIIDLVQRLMDELKDDFQLDDETIANAMQLLNFSPIDLIEPDNLQEFLVNATGMDMLSFVVDDGILSKFNALLEKINQEIQPIIDILDLENEQLPQVLEDFRMNNDDFSRALEAMVSNSDEKTMDSFENNSEREIVLEEDNKLNKTDKSLSDIIESKITNIKTDNGKTSLSGNKQNNSFSQNDNNEGRGNLFAERLATSVEQIYQGNTVENEAFSIGELDIVNQVIEKIDITAGKELKSIEIVLNPENLGKVQVNVSTKNGIVTAQFVAENEQVKKALENQMISLKENFNNQGIKVEAVEVTIASHSFDANMSRNSEAQAEENKAKTRKNLDLTGLDDLEDGEMIAEELRMRDSLIYGESSVEYKA